MNILITGGAGFLGSHLAEMLSPDHRVTVLDNFSTGQRENLVGIDCVVVEDDVRGVRLTESYDIIYHAAAMVGQERCHEDREGTIDVNVRGTENILNQAREARVVVFSSSEVYRDNSIPMAEEIVGSENLDDGEWPPYAYSKLMNEKQAMEHGNSVIIRPFNTVGERQVGHYGMVVPRFVRWALRNEPILVYGDGSQSRTFAYAKESARCIIALSRNDDAVGETVNVGSTRSTSVNNLAKRIKELTDSTSEIRYVPHEEVFGPDFKDVQERVPNVTKLRGLAGYVPSMDLDAILEFCIDYQKSMIV